MSDNSGLTYLPGGVELTPLTECPWCSSEQIFQIALRGDGLPVMRCSDCHLAFLGELPDDLSVFYDEGYFERSAFPNTGLSETGYENYDRSYSPSSFRWLAMLIRSLVGSGKDQLFDLGSATGTFLEAAELEGFRTIGSELSEQAAGAARDKGLDVRGGPFDPVHWTSGSFDVVTALEVLEHVRDVRTLMVDLAALLKQQGLFVFFVPILSDNALRRYGSLVSDLQAHYEHTLYFNESFLHRMCDELFGPGHLQLWAPEVEEHGQSVTYGLGFLRPDSDFSPREEEILRLLVADSWDGSTDLAQYEAIALALTASKVYNFSKAATALEDASDRGGDESLTTFARAQVLRSRGELLSAIDLLEEVMPGSRLDRDPLAAALLIETLEDLLTMMKIERPGLGPGLRELSERFEGMRIRLAEEAIRENERQTFQQVIDALTSQLAASEDIARHSVQLLEENRGLNAAIQSDLDDLRNGLSRERAAATELSNENARLRNNLNDIYVSRAWRLVSRLRSILQLPSRVRSLSQQEAGTTGLPDGATPAATGPTRIWYPPPDSYPYLVSVVMPVYNKGSTLRGSIDSVLGQTLTSVEIVVWDDGSDDEETLAVLDGISSLSNVTVFRADNQGVVGARNSGIAMSRGRYICCLDPDDEIAPTYLEMAVALLEAQPEYAIAYPWVHSTGDVDERWETQDLDASLILRANHLPVCAVARREVFFETGGFSSEMVHGYEDWELWAHAAELGFRGKSIPVHLLQYRFSRDAGESRDAQAREKHDQLVEHIAKLHPRLARTGVPFDRGTPTTVRPVGKELGQRRIPGGVGRPVVMTLPWFTVGGADRVVAALARRWVEDGRTVVVFTTKELAPGMSNQLKELELVTPYVYPLSDFLPEPQWYEFLASTISSLDSPVIFNVGSSWFHENAKALRRDFPGLFMVDQQFNTLAHLPPNRAIAELLDLTIAAYDGLADEISADGRSSPVAPIYVGIDETIPPQPEKVGEFRREVGLRDGESLLLFVGRLADEKRPEWVVRLASDDRLPRGRVVILGDGPLRDQVAAAASSNSRLVWMPSVDRIEPAVSAADLIVLPSKIEGIPLIAMEALALGTPIVATRVGGLPDLEGEPGVVLVDPHDFNQFVETIAKTLHSEMGQTRLPKRFSTEVMLEQYDRLLFPDD